MRNFESSKLAESDRTSPRVLPILWRADYICNRAPSEDIVARGARLSFGAHVGGAAVGGIYGATHVCSTYLWAMAQNY